jgi:hypothetical protein
VKIRDVLADPHGRAELLAGASAALHELAADQPPHTLSNPEYDDLSTRVTYINGRWHVRLLSPSGRIVDEMACDVQRDITYICRTMLRWQDKLGAGGPHASAARERLSEPGANTPHGRIWYRGELEEEKSKREGIE